VAGEKISYLQQGWSLWEKENYRLIGDYKDLVQNVLEILSKQEGKE